MWIGQFVGNVKVHSYLFVLVWSVSRLIELCKSSTYRILNCHLHFKEWHSFQSWILKGIWGEGGFILFVNDNLYLMFEKHYLHNFYSFITDIKKTKTKWIITDSMTKVKKLKDEIRQATCRQYVNSNTYVNCWINCCSFYQRFNYNCKRVPRQSSDDIVTNK